MNDEFMTLLDRYRQPPNQNMEGIFIYQQEPAQQTNSQQMAKGLLGNSADLANNMIGLGQQQAQEAMNSSAAFQSQQQAMMNQTQAQAAQALERQKQEEAQKNALLGRIALSIATGGFGGGSGAVGGSVGDVYSGGWLV